MSRVVYYRRRGFLRKGNWCSASTEKQPIGWRDRCRGNHQEQDRMSSDVSEEGKEMFSIAGIYLSEIEKLTLHEHHANGYLYTEHKSYHIFFSLSSFKKIFYSIEQKLDRIGL